MLSVLHNQIEKIVPINGVSQNRDGTFDIFYVETPTDQQIVQVNQIISNWPLEKKKLEKLAKIDVEWNQTIAQGWNSNQGFTLGLSANDVALISGVFALAKEAAALNLPLPQIIALDNTAISFNSINEMIQLLLQYGSARAQLSSVFASRRKAVENATSIEEVNGV